MSQAIKLVGLDCGSTTTSAIVAAARLTKRALGRVEITAGRASLSLARRLHALRRQDIDAARLDCLLDEWLAGAATASEEIFGGGALVTGLAAQQKNAAAIVALIEARMADSVIATADDPALESWLAFMGNCHALSKAHPTTTILNLDIGGGTTNLAWGLNGQVAATGCLFVGARHFDSCPGLPTDRHLALRRGPARRICESIEASAIRSADHEIDSILDFYLGLIVAAVETWLGQR